MSDHPAPQPRPSIVVPDAGGWISGPCVDDVVMAAALAVACPIHQVDAGDPCPLVGACLARQSIAPDLS
jgi:hypothetical protein